MEITPQWLAGFIDGEGCITIFKAAGTSERSPHYTPGVTIVNTHLPTLLVIQAAFGGVLHQSKRTDNPNWNQRWSLHWNGTKTVIALLTIVRPFLITKAAEAMFMLDVWIPRTKWRRGHPVSDEQLLLRESLKCQLSAMKRNNYPTMDSTSN